MDVIQWLSRGLVCDVRHYNRPPAVEADGHGRLRIALIDYDNQSWGLIADRVAFGVIACKQLVFSRFQVLDGESPFAVGLRQAAGLDCAEPRLFCVDLGTDRKIDGWQTFLRQYNPADFAIVLLRGKRRSCEENQQGNSHFVEQTHFLRPVEL